MRALALAGLLLAACATAPKPVASDTAAAAATAALPVARTPPPAPLAAVKRVEPESRKYALANGLQLVVVEDHRRPLVATRLFLASGAAADIAERAGATYFAISLLADSYDLRTESAYPVDPLEKSARRQVMELGGALKFDVTEDTAWIGIDGFAADTPEYLRMLSSIVQRPRHSEDAFLGHVMGMSDALDELEVADAEIVDEYLNHLAFGEDTAYSRPFYGTPSSLSRLGVEDVVERQAALLTPSGGTLLVAGDVSPNQVLAMAERTFGRWRPGVGRTEARVEAPPVRACGGVTLLPRSPSHTTMVCAARPLTDVSASTSTLALLVSVLGQSRLSNVLREQHGLTYTVSANVLQHRSARALLACSRLSGRDFGESLKLFISTVTAMAKTPPTDEEVERARAGLITTIEASQDDVAGVVEAWQLAIAWKKPVSVAAQVAELKKASPADVRKLTATIFKPELIQYMFSGEPGVVGAAVKANRLGPMRTPKLAHVEE